uniref:Serpentine receptor class r-10 n=1 Tax=Caenorhabditis tropicalis TaxID=1561998 RepID=A0A1I7T1J9_9PELO
MSVPLEIQVIQLTGFILSEVSHFVLLYFIYARATKQFGSYKILMASFSIFSILYAFAEVITQPVMHIHGTGLMLYVGSSVFTYSKEFGHYLSVFYCSSFALCVFFLSAHFFYRYVAVCSPRLLRLIDGYRVFRLLIPIFVLGTLMFINVSWFGAPSDFKSEFMRESLKKEYNDDSYTVGQISAVFYVHDPSGAIQMFWKDCIGMIFVYIILFLSISTIIFFAVNTFRTVYHHSKLRKSKKNCEIHRQLFHTLIVQSMIPMVILFLPTGFLLTLPFFDVKEVGRIANAPGVGACFYPALDALTAMIMIKDFRRALFCAPKVPRIRVSSVPDTMFTHLHS